MWRAGCGCYQVVNTVILTTAQTSLKLGHLNGSARLLVVAPPIGEPRTSPLLRGHSASQTRVLSVEIAASRQTHEPKSGRVNKQQRAE